MKTASFIFAAILLSSAIVEAQSGGTYSITQSVVAGGGRNSSAPGFSVDGTVGQALAGDPIAGGPFSAAAGFWNFTPLSPTAASVNISGTVKTWNGRGLKSAVVTLTRPNGSVQTTLSTTMGYFRFGNVSVGQTYIVSVSAKRFVFSEPQIVVSVFDEVTGLNFIADR